MALQPNQEIPAERGKDIRNIEEMGATLTEHLNDVVTQVQGMIGDVQAGKGTLGQLITDPTIANHITRTADNLDKLIAGVQGGQGTLGKLGAVDKFTMASENSVVGRADDIFAAMQQQKGSIGKFIYRSDPAR